MTPAVVARSTFMEDGEVIIARRAVPVLLVVSAVSAKATNFGPFSGTGWDASAFNVIALGTNSTGLGANNAGNFVPSSDVGGRVAAFGNYTGNGYQINSQATSVPNPYSETYSLIVNGSISTNPFTVGNGSSTPAQSVYVGGTYSANVFNSPYPTVSQSPSALDFDFVSARTSLDTLSSNTLAHYSGAITATPASNGTNYFVAPSGTGLFVYNVDVAYFTNQNLAFEVDISTGQSVIINVTGANSSLTLSKGTVVKMNGTTVNANTTGGVPVLFNLPSVTSLSTSNGAINGSILAPFATFASPNQTVDGQLFVASVNGLAETHDQYYSGTLPSVATPEPSTLSSLGLAAIALALLRRRTATHC
jgi:choice-of-anchor A domain-containing protein